MLPLGVRSLFFTFPEDASQPSTEFDDLKPSNSSLDDLRKQGVAHIPIPADQVLNSDGDERVMWMAAGRKELDNLTSTGTIQALSLKEKETVKEKTGKEGEKHIEFLSKGVCTMNPDKCKVRMVACGNETPENDGKIWFSTLLRWT